MAKKQETPSKKVLDSMIYSALQPKSICTCGHDGDGARSAHCGFGGHGSCNYDGGSCCGQFTWSRWHPDYVVYMKSKGYKI